MKDLPRWVIEAKLASEAQLAEAQKRETPLPMALIDLGLIEEKALVDLIAKRTGLPRAPRRMHRMDVSQKALSLVPQDYCWQFCLFPFGIDAATRRLQLAILDAEDAEAVATVRRGARLELALYVAGPKQIEKAIRRHYLDSLVEETGGPGQLRYFGYENITSPGARTRPMTAAVRAAASDPAESGELSWEEPGPLQRTATSDLPLPPPSRHTPSEPGVPIPPGTRPTGAGNPAARNPQAMEDDLPIAKEPSGQVAVGRLGRDPLAELAQRVDSVEQLLARLVALLAHDTSDTAGQLTRLNDELRSIRHRTRG